MSGAHRFDEGLVVRALGVRRHILCHQRGRKVLKLLRALWLQLVKVHIAAKQVLRRRQVCVLNQPALTSIQILFRQRRAFLSSDGE